MRHFRTHKGDLINPANVTHVTLSKSKKDGSFILKYNFTSGASGEFTFNSHPDAVDELNRYDEHCQLI